jgi:hypothetical protein
MSRAMQLKTFNPSLTIWASVMMLSLFPISISSASSLTLVKPALPSGEALNEAFDMKDAAYRPSPREQYFQTWNAYWKTDDGFHIFANFVISNMGIGDNTCGLNIAIVTPDGRSDVETLQLKGKHFKGQTDKLELHCGKATWIGDGETITIRATLNRLAIDMVMKRTTPGFNPPIIYLDSQHQDELGYNMPHINSVATGRIKLDNTWHQLKGRAIVEHLAQNVALHVYSRVWHRIRVMDGETSLVIGGFEPSEDMPEGYTLLVLAKEGKILHATHKAVLKATAFEKDEESGYLVPTAFEVSLDDPILKLNATIKRERPINRIDVLEQLNWFLRIIVRTFFTNPWLFRQEVNIDATYSLHGETQKITTKAMQEAIFVND